MKVEPEGVAEARKRRRGRQQMFTPKIFAAATIKWIALAMPRIRIGRANNLGMLMSSSAVAHKVVPAAKEGILPAGPAAVPESRTPSPIAKTRKPPATMSFLDKKYFKASKAVAITKPALSIAHQKCLQIQLRNRGPCQAEHATERKADDGHDVDRTMHRPPHGVFSEPSSGSVLDEYSAMPITPRRSSSELRKEIIQKGNYILCKHRDIVVGR